MEKKTLLPFIKQKHPNKKIVILEKPLEDDEKEEDFKSLLKNRAKTYEELKNDVKGYFNDPKVKKLVRDLEIQ